MFPKTNNIEIAFKTIRHFFILVIALVIGLCAFVIWQSYRIIKGTRDKIYVLAGDKILEGFGSDRKENIPVEARDHIRTFHHDFFTLAPDEKAITIGITRALYLADGSAKRLYDNLKETGYYTDIITANISQQITIDSITLDMSAYPWHFRCNATQKIIRTSSIVTRDLITEGWLRITNRSDNNPHGLLIENWNTIENKDEKVEKR